MEQHIKGKVHVYNRSHINTDEIIPAVYLTSFEQKELGKHAMEIIDKDFSNKVNPGDILVAGDDFGCGSSREHAVWAISGTGIKAIIANSFARIFYRNCINNGFLAIECRGLYKETDNGDEIEIDLTKGIIKNHTKKKEYRFIPIPEFVMKIIEAGGLLDYIDKYHKEPIFAE